MNIYEILSSEVFVDFRLFCPLYWVGRQSWDILAFFILPPPPPASFIQAVMGPFVKRAKETNERNDIPKLKENESGKCEENLNEKWFRDMNIFGPFITGKHFSIYS